APVDEAGLPSLHQLADQQAGRLGRLQAVADALALRLELARDRERVGPFLDPHALLTGDASRIAEPYVPAWRRPRTSEEHRRHHASSVALSTAMAWFTARASRTMAPCAAHKVRSSPTS